MKILLKAFMIFFYVSTINAGEIEFLDSSSFVDGEVKLLKYELPSSVQVPPASLTFKIFKLKFFGFRKDPNTRTYYALISSPLGILKGDFEMQVYNDKTKIHEELISLGVRTNLKTEEVLKTEPEIVLPEKTKNIQIVAEEDAELNNLYQVITPERYWDGKFIRPISTCSESSPFGIYRVYTKHLRRRTHWGIDYRCPIGTNFKASGAGKVVFASSLYFPGKTIVIDHGQGLYTGYSHLSKMNVKVGDMVKRGQVLGKTGISGKNTGPLIHWFAINGRVKIDPDSLLNIKLP